MTTRTAQEAFLRTQRFEARIIVPIIDGQRTTRAHDEFELRALKAFGGFTRLPGDGAWQDNKGIVHYDEVWCYDIAMLDCRAKYNSDQLYSLAAYVKDAWSQQSVYVRFPDGHVEFVS